MRLGIRFFIVIGLLATVCHAQNSPSDSAETRMLRAQVAKQATELQQLRKELAELRGRSGIAASQPAAAAPATAPPAIPPGLFSAKSVNRVVFTVVSRGAMLTKFGQVRDEITKAVGNLKPADEFSILILQERQIVSLAPRPLKATADSAARAQAFLAKMNPRGEGSSFAPLIKAAAALNPTRVWIIGMMDGCGPGEVAAVLSARGGKSFPIDAMAALGDSDTDTETPAMMPVIASETGGICIDMQGKTLAAKAMVPALGRTPVPPPKGPSLFDQKFDK